MTFATVLKYNKCHTEESGKFCETSGGGTPTPYDTEEYREQIKVPAKAHALIAKHLSKEDTKSLAKAFGLDTDDPVEVTKYLVKAWRGGGAAPNNDYGRFDVLAPAIQMAAQKEFGLKDTDQSFNRAFQVMLQSGKLGDPTVASRELFKEHGQALRGFLRAQYTATQEVLAKQGIKHMVLFRGVRANSHKQYPGLGSDVPVVESEANLRPIASFASQWNEARQFAIRNWVGTGNVGQIIGARVAAKDILALPGFGLGKASESEVVVLGGLRKVIVGNAVYHHGLLVDGSTHPHVAEAYDYVKDLYRPPGERESLSNLRYERINKYERILQGLIP